MKQYLSIPAEVIYGLPIYMFEKLDGSNIRAEWNRKQKGFTKFGSRTVLLDESHEKLGKAIPLIRSKYESILTERFLEHRLENVTCFFEFYGPNSFAGFHDQNEEQTVTLIDANVYKKGFIYPNEFMKLFKDIETAKLIYTGNVTQDIEEQIRSGIFEGMSFEGVICKSATSIKKGYPPTMFKIKNRAWIQKVKDLCNGNLELEKQLL